LGVFGLSQTTSQETIEDIFGKHGKIEKVVMIVDRQTQRSKGFGFVYFTDVEGATKAKNACNGMVIDGRKIRTDYSITLKPHEPTPGKYYGKVTDYRRSSPQRSSSSYGRERNESSSRESRDSRDSREGRSSESRNDREEERYGRY